MKIYLVVERRSWPIVGKREPETNILGAFENKSKAEKFLIKWAQLLIDDYEMHDMSQLPGLIASRENVNVSTGETITVEQKRVLVASKPDEEGSIERVALAIGDFTVI